MPATTEQSSTAVVQCCRLHQEFEQIESAPSELYASGVTPKTIGLIVLVPAVLGVERLNEVYSAQLRTVLRWKQSVGIVGGRPGHSYYFLGYQVSVFASSFAIYRCQMSLNSFGHKKRCNL